MTHLVQTRVPWAPCSMLQDCPSFPDFKMLLAKGFSVSLPFNPPLPPPPAPDPYKLHDRRRARLGTGLPIEVRWTGRE